MPISGVGHALSDLSQINDGFDENDPGAGGGMTETERVEKLTAQRLEQATEAQIRSKVLAEFSKDPAFAKLAQARIEQKKVHVLTDDELSEFKPATESTAETGQGQGQQTDDEPDYENMSKKQLMGAVLKNVSQMIDATTKKRLEPFQQKVGQLEDFAGNLTQQQVNADIAATAKKYPDLPAYKDRMLVLSNENRRLSVEQLYLLAKAEAGHMVPKQTRMLTERPSNVPGRVPKQRNHTAEGLTAAFNTKLSSIIENFPDDAADYRGG